MNIRRIILSLSLSLLSAMLWAQPRVESQRLSGGWEFLQGDLGGIWEAVRVAQPERPEAVPLWSKVTLPHCFNAEDAVDPNLNYYQGPGWYRTNLRIDNPYREGRTILHFEGAGQKTELYVYTTKVGSHVGGYDEFSFDITDAAAKFLASEDAARFGGAIPVSIRVDNSRDLEMVPSDMSDFNVYGGIYRHLNLVYTPALAIKDLIIDASVDARLAEGVFEVKVNLENHSNLPSGDLSIEVRDPKGVMLFSEKVPFSETGNTLNVFKKSVKRPLLWSPDAPNLYSVSVTVNSAAGSMTATDRFGFRNFEFVEKGPFVLNGQRLLLRGVHRHEDHAGVSAAMTDSMIRSEMMSIKRMGANFIRLGHYQQSRLVLELCDELGILVWEEIPWCRGGLGGEVYKEQARRMLTNMIAQHRNHPSIILWGMGNENDWPNDFSEFDRDKIRTFMTELHNLSHKLDDSRLTAIRRCSFCSDVVDVYSPSIWAGWYKGAYVDYKGAAHAEMLALKRFFHAEWGADSHAGRFAEDPHIDIDYAPSPQQTEVVAGKPYYTGKQNNSKVGQWSENYACELIDWTLNAQCDMPWLTGSAYWSFKDFSTPLRPENPVAYVNQKGLTERDLTPKEAYYVFQSYWAKEPMARIFGHNWKVRWGDAGEQKQLLVYSNCDEAELFLNGRSLGKRIRTEGDFPASGLRWDTPLTEGENNVKVVAKKGKNVVTDEITFRYTTTKWSKPAHIKASTTPAEAGYVWIEAQLVDAAGAECLDAADYIEFELAGDGKLIQNQGTSSASRRVQATNGRARIKVETNDSRSVVAVKSADIPTVFVNVNNQ